MTVMVVDDEESSRELLVSALADIGITDVLTATDGREAMRLFDRMDPKPDLMVCDVFMPNMDGFEILNELESRHFRGAVVLVSGGSVEMLALARDVGQAGSMQVLGALTKPVSLEALATLLGSQIDALTHPSPLSKM